MTENNRLNSIMRILDEDIAGVPLDMSIRLVALKEARKAIEKGKKDEEIFRYLQIVLKKFTQKPE